MSNPNTIPIPILRNASIMSMFRQFYLRLKCLSINKEQNLHICATIASEVLQLDIVVASAKLHNVLLI
jgi:hypothetical protein